MSDETPSPRRRPTRIRNAHLHPGRKGEVRKRAEILLADGEWHQYERVVSQLIRLVPPGVAARRAEAMRKASSNYEGPEKRVRHRDLDQVIRTGARAVVKDVLRDERAFVVEPSGRLDDPSVRKVRMIIPEDEPLSHEDFTPLQMQVLQMTAAGIGSLDISRRLGLRAESNRVNGARGIMWPLISKFETTNMAATVYKARELGILPPAPALEGVDALLVDVLARYKSGNGPYLAEKLDVDYNVFDQARRRLYGRYGVNTMAELREKLEEEARTPEEKRDRLQAHAVEMYLAGMSVRGVCAAMDRGYGTVYDWLERAGALRKRPLDEE